MIEPRKKFYTDDPLWSMPRPAAARNVTPRKLSEYYDFFENTLFTPGETGEESRRVSAVPGRSTPWMKCRTAPGTPTATPPAA